MANFPDSDNRAQSDAHQGGSADPDSVSDQPAHHGDGVQESIFTVSDGAPQRSGPDSPRDAVLDQFHPAVSEWFDVALGAPTSCQSEAWGAIRGGEHTLIAAPTGSGKTLAAFLSIIDDLVVEALEFGGLPDETRVVYISPLKALSNDIERNLQAPLRGINEALEARGINPPTINVAVRTGDTTATERDRMRRRAPHILVTTPESLFILLSSESGRRMLATTTRVIVDEIHALAGNKRGSHLSLSLERLEALGEGGITRIGLSATQKPVERVAAYLTGHRPESGVDLDAENINSGIPCRIIDIGHVKKRDLALELPGSPLEAVMPNEVWGDVYDRLAELAVAHRTTLIFVNTRRLAERMARALAERLGEECVTSHHGSLSREHRLKAEQRLKAGELKALVATASLELGIDIGDIDLVCQIGSPRALAAFLQRVGRSGHAVGQVPKGRLFPTSRDDLAECVALLDGVKRGELDELVVPAFHRDVLAQQIVGEVGSKEWDLDDLYQLVTRAWQYRDLSRPDFDAIVDMLGEGFSTRRGRRSAYLHVDAVGGRVRGRRGARLTAVTNSGAIPDQFDYNVILEPEGLSIGTLNEDFAFESVPGDIFQLGNTSYRVLRVERGAVRVEDAHGQPPTIPFWFGEAPGRSDCLSEAVSRLRNEMNTRLDDAQATKQWLMDDLGLVQTAAEQLIDYYGGARAALGVLPTQDEIVLERFFDDAGDMHLVIHSPFGSRINRGWGLALRKKFCRNFNFELQAAALEDSIILSLGATHSFKIDEVLGYLNEKTVRDVLIQALLDAPMFEVRWRWVANIALAVRRFRGGRKVPPPLQRADAEDLVALVFPDQLACLENIQGPRDVPDHPLVTQAIEDCLNELMDIEGLQKLIARVEGGLINVRGLDLTEPSPLAAEILTARPYAFLDDAPAEERRTMAVRTRRFVSEQDAGRLAHLDKAAIDRVVEEAWPEPRDVDELHDALVVTGFITERELESSWTTGTAWMKELVALNRATWVSAGNHRIAVAAERVSHAEAIFGQQAMCPVINGVGSASRRAWTMEEALVEFVRGRLEVSGPITVAEIAELLGLQHTTIEVAVRTLENEGFVLVGNFTGSGTQEQWCERRLLARIHRATLEKLRREIEPVSLADFTRFVIDWHGLGENPGGLRKGLPLRDALSRLEGFEAPLPAWESELLARRVDSYQPDMLDRLTLGGEILWARLPAARRDKPLEKPQGNSHQEPDSDEAQSLDIGNEAEVATSRAPRPIRSTPVTFLFRASRGQWQGAATEIDVDDLGEDAARVKTVLDREGALYIDELEELAELPVESIEIALAELVWRGVVTSDGVSGLRRLMVRKRGVSAVDIDIPAGRWSTRRTVKSEPSHALGVPPIVEKAVWTLLGRYGVVFRGVLAREPKWMPRWRELVPVLRRLEAQGLLRGGRFVGGVSGEQFALPDAVSQLRTIRRRPPGDDFVVVNATDPVNLVGTVLPGPRVPGVRANRVLYRDGICIGIQYGKRVEWQTELDAQTAWKARNALAGSEVIAGEAGAPVAPADASLPGRREFPKALREILAN